MLRCPHCYINAGAQPRGELTTAEGRDLLQQVADAGTTILILSGGEPLLREDIFDLARFGTRIGLRMAMGTSGVCISDSVAAAIHDSGIRKVAISLDSVHPEKHDRFRGYPGAFDKAVQGIEHCRNHQVPVQLNIMVYRDNYGEIRDIIHFGKNRDIQDIQLFFLVPTGRGSTISDITPDMYEQMVREVLILSADEGLTIRPTCAPQFMRIARELGIVRKEWKRGCIAGRSYCRIDPTGEVTPCPYLPVTVGNIRETAFRELWEHSEILAMLRDTSLLEGKCGRCEYAELCGGCRARAYGISRLRPYVCGDLDRPGKLTGNILAEEPWCPYQPEGGTP